MIEEILQNNNPEELKALFSFDKSNTNDQILFKFNLWGRFFFPQYFKSPDAEFHNEMNEANLNIYKGKLDSFINIAFRGAGKDVKTELFLTYTTLNDLDLSRRFIKVLSSDPDNSISSVTGIYNRLVSPRIQGVYGNVFEKTIFKREERKDAFTTVRGIKFLAGTVGTEQRGDKQDEARPDIIWYNDFESRSTLRSAVKTKAIWDNMEEARTGLELGGACIYTCNYISEAGNVHRLVTLPKHSRRKLMIIPIIDDKGIIAWNRYTIEDIEAMKATDDDFEGERLCKPNASKDIYFDREELDKQPIFRPIKEISGFKIFKEYKPGHRYAGGHDVAGGVGLDSSTSVFIDFDTFPAQVVATYANNNILPEAFGDEIYSQSNRFGGCLIAPENNKFDQTILKASQLGAKLYTGGSNILKIVHERPKIYGWNTNSLTKSKMLSSLREAIESGLLLLSDEDLINELKSYTVNDLIDRSPDVRLTTRHFDLLTACAIAWQMKEHARPAKVFDLDFDLPTKEENPAI